MAQKIITNNDDPLSESIGYTLDKLQKNNKYNNSNNNTQRWWSFFFVCVLLFFVPFCYRMHKEWSTFLWFLLLPKTISNKVFKLVLYFHLNDIWKKYIIHNIHWYKIFIINMDDKNVLRISITFFVWISFLLVIFAKNEG